MTERRIRCALLTHNPFWSEAVLLACPGLELVALSPSPVGVPEDGNPLGLPEDDRADVVLVTAGWYRWLTVGQDPERADEVVRALERRADVIVGLDGASQFASASLPRRSSVSPP